MTLFDDILTQFPHLFEIYNQFAPWAQSPSRTSITQLDETHELTPAKSQSVWTLVDN